MNIRISTTFRAGLLAAAFALLVAVIPARAAEPFGDTACSGVRPGAIIQGPKGTIYTMGFVFKGTGAKSSAYYVTTVGNKVLPTFGKKIWRVGGPAAYDANNKQIGRFVYASHTDTPAFSTFGLVQLDKKVKFKSQLCHFGGPTDFYGAQELMPRTLEYYGNGFPVDQVFPARTALAARGTTDGAAVYAQAVFALLDTGDEGAPFITDGKAVGFWDGGIGAGGGFVIRRLGPELEKVEKALKIELVLLTAKRL